MFAVASDADPYPGIGVEMEWNNKDPFYDRDLLNFQALHREGALAVGAIVTRGPELQRLIGPTIRHEQVSWEYEVWAVFYTLEQADSPGKSRRRRRVPAHPHRN